jgi:hypothetical protein
MFLYSFSSSKKHFMEQRALYVIAEEKYTKKTGRNGERSSLMRGIVLINKPVSTIMGRYDAKYLCERKKMAGMYEIL